MLKITLMQAFHRNLKSKEDAIGDVAREYRESALQLLNAMDSRHTSDRIESCVAHESASHCILRAFSLAETEMKDLVGSMQALKVRDTMASVKHPEFLKKLDRVYSLYNARLGKYAQDATSDEVADGEAEEEAPQKGELCDEAMVNDFCVALRNKPQQNDDATSSMLRKVHDEADRLLYGHPHHKGQEHRSAPVEEAVKKVNDKTIEAWDVELDVLLDTGFEMGHGINPTTTGGQFGRRAAFRCVAPESRNAEYLGGDDGE